MTEGLVALVATKSAITDLIGTDPMRMDPVFLPQKKTYPAITFKEMPLEPTNTFDGASTYDFHHLDIHFYAKTYDVVNNIFDVFRTEIEDSVGTFAGVNIDHVWFVASGMEDYIDDYKYWTKQMELKIAVKR